MSLEIKHDLSKLSPQELTQYLRDVSEFIGLDPNLNSLDTIWMLNENGPGQSLVVYARRGTAEILRNLKGIDINSLTQVITPQGSIVFTATGKDKNGRQEIAIGSKFIGTLSGKALDDAIMTASTRALRRVTMQFTSLGILDESEVNAVQGSNANPAAGATLAGSSMVVPPPVPSVAANNGPGKDVTPPRVVTVPPALSAPYVAPLVDQKVNLEEVYREGAAALKAMPTPGTSAATSAKADKNPAISEAPAPVTPVVAPVTSEPQADIKAAEPAAKPKRARKKANTVSMDGPEPEVVSSPASAPEPMPAPAPVPPAAPVASPAPVEPPPPAAAPVAQSTDFEGKPTPAQMDGYRKRVGVYTAELPSSENMGSVQKMRAFITRMSGAAPQFMTTDQWEETLAWFESFVAKNKVKGLVSYINDSLGVK